MKINYKVAVFVMALQFSCTGLLDEKPQKNLIVPVQLSELRAILDNTSQAMNLEPGLIELSSDDLVLDQDILPRLFVQEVNSYLWADDIYGGEEAFEWGLLFKAVQYANVVLDQLLVVSIPPQEEQEWKDLEGSALFYRAYAYWGLTKTFCLAYDDQADKTLGMPLRYTGVITNEIKRASLKETLEFILADLQLASGLLGTTPEIVTRPSREAAFALLAEVYLFMGEFNKSLEAAEKSLTIKNDLMDYNEFDTVAVKPFPRFNRETIFYSVMAPYLYQIYDVVRVDPALYLTYEGNDLRKHLYYEEREGFVEFKGSYTGMIEHFSGLAVDQVILTRAECLARLGREAESLEVLNKLLSTRWKAGKFVSLAVTAEKNTLDLVLEERRKSLVFRGVRWADLKRLNLDPKYSKDLQRVVNGKEYKLPAGSPKYAFPISDQEINLTGMVQNPR